MRDIWEEFRAALCISVRGERRTPPSLPPPDLTGGREEEEEEEEEDRLSALPDEVLLFILSRLRSAAAAARTSVLSRRWRCLWAQLPVLWFPLPAEKARCASRTRVHSHRWRRLLARLPALRSPLAVEPPRARPSPASARAALAQHSAPSLLMLNVVANDASPADTATVLRLAAPRLTDVLFFRNVVPEDRKKALVREVIELPCFDRAVRLFLYLGYLHLALPLSGVFRKLTTLVLGHVRFQGALDIGDTLSSARCPSLRLFHIFDAQGVSNLGICSESLVSMTLHNLEGLQQLTLVSPMLRDLHIFKCFFKKQPSLATITAPVADITAPVLEKFGWLDEYDPMWVQLGELAQLRALATSFFAGAWYEWTEQHNLGNVKLLQRFKKIPDLYITIFYPIKMMCSQYGMETLTSLPVKKLYLVLVACGHAIGSCVFHILKISTSIRRLFLDIRGAIKEGAACSPDCFCHGEQDWEAGELFLNSLQELYIFGFSGSDYDSTFVERLLGWAGMLKSVTINFDPKATVDEDLCEELLGLSGPETSMKIYLYRDGAKVMYTSVG